MPAPGQPDFDSLRLPLGAMPNPLPIPCIAGIRGRPPLAARIRTPGSKSLTNRALLLAALARGESVIRRPLADADDALRMLEALRAMGAEIRSSGDSLVVRGVGGRWTVGSELTLNLNNAGTATRFLAAAAMLSPVPIIIDGNDRMRQRPIEELAEALQELGAEVRYLGTAGCPPIRIAPPASLPRAASLELPTTLSSQFVSALLLIAPWLPGGLTIKLEGEVTSRSYVQMTVGLLDALGATVRTSDTLRIIRVAAPPGGLPAFEYAVEPDASGATYFWAAAALFPGAVCRVEGLDSRSLQGDANFPETLSRMGATVIQDDAGNGVPSIGVRGPTSLAPVMADMSDMPDAALTLAVVAAFAGGRSIIRGLGTLRVKETDRIKAIQTELAKVGVKVESPVLGDADAITVNPPREGIDCSPSCPPVEFDTYDDHRMAMALSLVGLRRPNTRIREPGCVAKTYPGYWRDLGTVLE